MQQENGEIKDRNEENERTTENRTKDRKKEEIIIAKMKKLVGIIKANKRT